MHVGVWDGGGGVGGIHVHVCDVPTIMAACIRVNISTCACHVTLPNVASVASCLSLWVVTLSSVVDISRVNIYILLKNF